VATFTDAGILDTHTATVAWGDGATTSGLISESGGAGVVSATHTYQDDGTYMAEVCVSDEDGGSACDRWQATVSNLAPSVTAGPDRIVNWGNPVSLAGAAFSDPGRLDRHVSTIDWGDGSAVSLGTISATDGAGTISAAYTYTRAGEFAVGVCAIDNARGIGCDNLQVTVLPSPDLQIAKDDGQEMVGPGQVLTYTLTIHNGSSREATGVRVTDTLPLHVAFVAASHGGVYHAAPGAVTWPAFDLAADASVVRTVTVRVADSLPAGLYLLINTAAVSDDGTHGLDPAPANNAVRDIDRVRAAFQLFLPLVLVE
jgi:uncharacterized repeat protein (TIGR01451 family)